VLRGLSITDEESQQHATTPDRHRSRSVHGFVNEVITSCKSMSLLRSGENERDRYGHSNDDLQPPPTQNATPPSRLPPKTPYTAFAKYCSGLPSTTINSFCGAMGGVASGIVTCPLDVIKTKLQAQGSFRLGRRQPTSSAIYRGMMGTARVIWREDGLRGMYRGLGPMLLGYLPTWAVYMSVYESSREYYYTRIGNDFPALPQLYY